jgi:signal transduction histidine kinase/ligand-binding sensor domain-containing protein/DNA-binding response OmpR family regulator
MTAAAALVHMMDSCHMPHFRSAHLLCLLICIQTLHAQERKITFEQVSREQGLSQSEVMCVIQDRTGYLWIGTQGGLNRYDGYTFTVYKNNVDDPNSLENNFVQALYEDRRGMLWIGTRGALHRFDRARGEFTRYTCDPTNEHTLSNNIITSICEDQMGTLWVGTDKGLNRFDPETQAFSRYFHDSAKPASLGSNGVKAMRTDHTGTFWIGTSDGLDYFDAQRTEFVHFMNDPGNVRSLSNNVVTRIYEDREGTLWIGTAYGLNRLDRAAREFTRYRHDPKDPNTLSDSYIKAISEDQTGTLWIGTHNGVNTFDRRSRRFTRYFNDPKSSTSLSGNRVNAIQSEPSGTVWIGTSGGGLSKVDRNKEQFAHIARDPNTPASLSSNLVWSIFEDSKGFLWVGTDDGLNRLDRSTATAMHYGNKPGDPHSLSNNVVYSILETRGGDLWVGTDSGLNLLDRRSNSFTRFLGNPKDTTALGSGTIFSLFEDHLGTVWVGTSGGGLFQYDQTSTRFRRWGPPTAIVARIFEDHQGTLWVCTWLTGLLRFDRNTGEFTQYLHDPHIPTSISNNTVYAIQETFDGGKPILWVATRSGLNRFDLATGQFKRYYEKDGPPGDLVYGVLVDDAGDLWLSTQNGLARFNPRMGLFTTFDVSDGLQSNEFSSGAFHKGARDELFFGGVNGLNAFRPEQIRANPHIPPVVVTAFNVFERPVPGVHSLADGDSVQLSYGENFFSFEFAALHFANPQKNQYAYKLEGFDKDWVFSGTRRYVSYTHLDPGEYVFRVKAENPSGVWNDHPTSIRLFISPPLWRTWWTYVLFVLIILAALYTIRRYELNRIRLKSQLNLETLEADKLKDLDRVKSQFFANISHEFRTPLTLILGQIESVMSSRIETKEKGKLQVALRNARRLLHLINQLLDLSKIEAGSMELRAERQDLISFLRNVVYSFESLAEQQRLTLEFESPADTLPVLFEQDQMEKVFYNLISNAFKFTPEGGEVVVEVKLEEARAGDGEKRRRGEGISPIPSLSHSPPPTVLIVVRDTGIGIPAAQLSRIFERFYQGDAAQPPEYARLLGGREGTGIGLALTKELVELHHGSISVTSTQGVGTEFVVRLPIDPGEHPAESPAYARGATARQEDRGGRDEKRATAFAGTSGSVSREIILVVEDNADVRAYIREQLGDSRQVLEAADGEEGIARARETIPDLIITDVMMPIMDGYQFTRNIRGDEKTSHIPIIMLTAKAALDDKIAGLEKGVDVYLTKPFSAKELKVQVRNLITRREELRRRFSTATIIKPSEVTATSIDKAFLERTINCVESHFEDEHFGVEQLAHEANMSISQVNRKLNALIAQPAGELIRSMRLRRAADLLEQNAGTVAEISYRLGFTDQAYFSRAFKKQFGCTPSKYKITRS